jgi:Fe-S oxidoreductase
MGIGSEESVLKRTGADMHSIDSGCCGMAGPFGFEKEKYEVSQAVGERVLLPAVRSTPENALIVSDGFSCREQIHQATGRKALHLAEALQLALRNKK